VSAFVTAGAGFLLAVLWFDLMFDVQVLRHRRKTLLPVEVLASIANYYARVTTAARPMNRLIALVMLATLTSIVVQIGSGQQPAWVPWASLALALGPILLAAGRVVPSAVRLGTRRDPVDWQSAAARSIFRDHVLCASGIAGVIVVQLAFA
jgi:hypothetical protein